METAAAASKPVSTLFILTSTFGRSRSARGAGDVCDCGLLFGSAPDVVHDALDSGDVGKRDSDLYRTGEETNCRLGRPMMTRVTGPRLRTEERKGGDEEGKRWRHTGG